MTAMRRTPLNGEEALCAYCGSRRAVNKDHVVPRQVRHSYQPNRKVQGRPRIPGELTGTVPSCFECNQRKGTRRLVPPSWADRVPSLNEFFGGVPWRVWDGNPMSTAFSAVHK